MRNLFLGAACAAAASTSVFSTTAFADGSTIAKNHAPIGVMGDHVHKTGEIMFSYRFMRMDMEGSRVGTNAITPDEIATTIPNRFFGAPMQPPTLRVVPTEMTMDMHMLGAMYGVTDWLTLMAMGQVVDKDMSHLTYQGGMGTTVLGGFQTGSSGFGDTKVGALVQFMKSDTGSVRHNAHLNLVVSLPTGSIIETDQILTPMGGTPTPRLPYPMQLGSGTFDFEPGVTYNGQTDQFSWGAQYKATLRSGDNDEGYSFGDKHEATAWAQFGPAPWIAFSTRVAMRAQDPISGIDAMVVAPVQTANPDFHGGDRIDIGAGINLAGQHGVIKGHRLAVEILFPVYQDLNGPQLETDWTLTVGWQKAF